MGGIPLMLAQRKSFVPFLSSLISIPPAALPSRALLVFPAVINIKPIFVVLILQDTIHSLVS